MRDPASLWHALRRMIAIRKQTPAFGSSRLDWLETGNPAVAAYLRPHPAGDVLALHNLTDSPQEIALPAAWQTSVRDLLRGESLTLPATLTLPPYAYRWLAAA